MICGNFENRFHSSKTIYSKERHLIINKCTVKVDGQKFFCDEVFSVLLFIAFSEILFGFIPIFFFVYRKADLRELRRLQKEENRQLQLTDVEAQTALDELAKRQRTDMQVLPQFFFSLRLTK